MVMDKTQLIYPNLNLFLYDLRYGLGSDKEQLQENRLGFWRKVDPQLDVEERVSQEKDYENKDFAWFKFLQFELPLDGFSAPAQLRDSYGLLVNYSIDKQDNRSDYSPQDYDQLPNLKNRILKHLAHGQDISQSQNCYGTLGQSWLLWAQVSTDTDTKSVAEACWEKLRPDDNWAAKPCYLGHWNGADIYEVLRFLQNWQQSWQEFQQHYHHLVLVLFHPSGSIEAHQNVMQVHYETFLKLFCFHNKMIWSYWRHQGQVKILHDEYGKLKSLMKNVQDGNRETLKAMRENLKKSLQFSSTYAIGLKDIQDQKHTITVNAHNHGKIWQEFGLNSPPQIREWIEETYLKQIEADYDSLAPVLPMTENLMRSLEGMINLEQTESDRELNDRLQALQVFGAALAVSSITATLVSTQVQEPTQSSVPPPPGWPFWYIILWTVGMGYLAMIGVLWGLRKERKK